MADNPVVGDWARLPEALAHDLFHFAPGTRPSPFWRPLVTLSYFVDHLVGGGAPWAFHLTNLLLLAVAGALLAGVLADLGAGRLGALAGVTLWLAHPLQVEGACNVAGRTDVLALLFLLLALRARGSTAAAAPTALACLAKETGVLAPLLRAAWPRPWGPAALVVLGWLGVRQLVVGGVDPGPGWEGMAAAAGRMVDALLAILAAAPPGPAALPVSRWSPAAAWAALFALGALAFALGRRRRAVRVGALLAAGSLAAASGLVSAHVRTGDTLLLLPWTGLLLAAAPWLARAWPAALALAVPLAVRGVGDVPRWRDEDALWSAAIAERPDDPLVRLHLARTRVGARPREALDLLAGVHVPDERLEREVHQVRGRALLLLAREGEALPELLAAVSGEPETAWATAAACVLGAPDGGARVVQACRFALRRSPDDPDLLNAAGLLAIRAGRPDRAVEFFDKASRLAPQVAGFAENLRRARAAIEVAGERRGEGAPTP